MKNETEKISLSFNIIRPPPISSELENFGAEKCFQCKKGNKYFMCLLCG